MKNREAVQRDHGVPGPWATFVRHRQPPLQEFREEAGAHTGLTFWFCFLVRELMKPILPAGPNTA